MTIQEERISVLERDVENEQEWRREIVREMRSGFDRLEARMDRLENNQRWLVGLLIAILIAVIASNWLG